MRAHNILTWIVLIIFVSLSSRLSAQQASAELISSHQPAKLSSGEQIREGIQNLLLKGNRLYLVNIWSGLQVLDVTDVKTPKEIGTYTAEGRGYNVVVDDHYAYLSQKNDGVLILDVTNPAQIKKVGRVRTEGDAYWVEAAYPYLYVAEESRGIGVYDISDLNQVKEVSHYDTPGWAWNEFLSEHTLYVGDKTGGLLILDVSNPAKLQRLGVFHGVKFTKYITVSEGIAYVAEGPDGLVLVDVKNKANPVLISNYATKGWVDHAYHTGTTVFLANDQQKRLEIIDVTDPNRPRQVGVYQSEYKIYASVKSGIYVFVAADQQTLVLRYNRRPQMEVIANQTVDENQLLSVQPQAFDPDQDAIRFNVEHLPSGAQMDTLTGLLTWTPDYEQSGVYKNITITVTEQTESALSTSRSFDITVNHVNRLPSLPVVENTEVNENTPLSFTIPEGSDPDKEDAGKLTYSVTGSPQGAIFDTTNRVFSWTPTFEQSGVYPLTFTVSDPAGGSASQSMNITVHHVDRAPVLADVGPQAVDENKELKIVLQGSDPDKEDQSALAYFAENLPEGASFDPATATFSWTPTYEQSGVYKDIRFIFKAGALSDTIHTDITVNHVNRPPVLNAITAQAVDENQLLTFTISGSDPDKEDAGKTTYSAENLPEGAVFNADSARFSWTPTYDQSGVYEKIVFRITDPSGLSDAKEVTITVNHVNRPPVLAELPAKTVDEHAELAFDLPGSDPDKEDEGKLSYTADQLPEGAKLDGARFSWTPTYDQSGSYTITFTVKDPAGLEDSKEQTITVNHVNRPPVLNAIAAQSTKENQTLTFTVSGSDPDVEDSGKLHISAANLPQGAVFDSSATFTWTPDFDQSGSYTIPFTITDPSGLTDLKEALITVEHVNRTPVFGALTNQTIDENQPLTYVLPEATDPDKEDAGKLVYSAQNLPEGASFDAASRTLSWTPTYEQSGQYDMSFSVTDGGFTVTQPLQVTVNHVNRAPQMEMPTTLTLDENKAWTLKLVYSDPDKEDQGKLTVEVANLPEGAAFDAVSATLTWTPTYEQAGTYKGIIAKVSDPSGLSDEKSFDLTVNNVNRTPQIQPAENASVKENESVSFTLQATDPDKEDQDKLTFSAGSMPAGATLDAQSGAFSWTPAFDQAGAYSITFSVSDGQAKAETVANITVENVNRAPKIEGPAEESGQTGSAVHLTFTGTDPDGDALTYSANGMPAGAALDAQSGAFTWTPGDDQSGDFTIQVTVSDGTETAQTETVLHIQPKPAPAVPDSSAQ